MKSERPKQREKREPEQAIMSKQFPTNLISEIACQLPVKSLLRFKCVSKPWRSVIEDPDFIKSYIKRSTETNTNLSLIINNGTALHGVTLDSLDNVTLLECPFKHPDDRIYVFGSCSGWVCTASLKREITLWNMSTKECHIVPSPPQCKSRLARNYEKKSEAKYGFGYDSMNDDYKVLRIQQFVCKDDGTYKCEAMVYSMNCNSWRKYEDLPYYIHHPQVGVFAGRAWHWVASIKPSCYQSALVLAVDVNVKEYSMVPLPEAMVFAHSLTLSVLGGCLCVTTRSEGVDLWVRNEYMVNKPWTKLISVLYSLNEDYPSGNVRALAYSESGDKVLLQDEFGFLLWYDLMEKTFKDIRIPGLSGFFIKEARMGIRTCVASLIPPSTVVDSTFIPI